MFESGACALVYCVVHLFADDHDLKVRNAPLFQALTSVPSTGIASIWLIAGIPCAAHVPRIPVFAKRPGVPSSCYLQKPYRLSAASPNVCFFNRAWKSSS
jgi:hypothetical protein